MRTDSDKKKRVVLITDSYPFGKGEITFIKPELKELLQRFEITIVSCGDESQNYDKKFLEDNNIQVEHYTRWDKGIVKKLYLAIKTIMDAAFWNDLRIIISKREKYWQRIHSSFWFVYESIMFRIWLEKNELIDAKNVYYSYWYYSHTLSLVSLKKNKRITSVITRAHGYDIHGFELKAGRECCKQYMDPWLDHIFFIAEEGCNYYLENEGIRRCSKHHLSHLGAPAAYGEVSQRLFDNREDTFTIVTCSAINIWKRLNLIVEAFALIEDKKFKWVHFGDGDLGQSIRDLAQEKLSRKGNIKYEFAGHVDRDTIYRYYEQNEANCYVLLSSSEGLPVANMEALANGLPMIVTDVGGCYETVDSNGVLLFSNPTPEEIKQAIESIMNASKEEYEIMRHNSYSLWKNCFDVDSNMKKFTEYIYEAFGG